MKKILAWQLTEVRNKSEVIAERWNKCHTVHVSSLIDLCHLKNSELEPKLQKYSGRVVLRGDIVKDDSGPSASQMTVANSDGRNIKATRVRRAKNRRNICLHPGQNGRCTIFFEDPKVRMSRYLDNSTKTPMAKIVVQHGRSGRSS